MRVKVNVLIGFLLCVLILCVVGVMRRVNENQDVWHPNEIYTHLGGSSYTSSSVSSHSSDGVVVAMRGVSRPSRRYVAVPAISYAPTQHSLIASTQYSIGGTPSNSVASPVYTTSSATMKSFGADMATGGMSMSGGSARNSQSPVANRQSLIVYSQLPVDMYASAYTPLSSSITAVGANSVAALPSRGAMKSGPRRVPGLGLTWDNWLDGLGEGSGWVSGDAGGIRYYNLDELREAFEAAQKNGQFPGWTWQDFLDQFFNNEDVNSRHFVPLGEPWVLLILALGYAMFRFVCSRRRSAVAARS